MKAIEYSFHDFKDGQGFVAYFRDRHPFPNPVEGIVTIEEGKGGRTAVFLCQDSVQGSSCKDKKGYKYSWVIYTADKGHTEDYWDTVMNLELGPVGKPFRYQSSKQKLDALKEKK